MKPNVCSLVSLGLHHVLSLTPTVSQTVAHSGRDSTVNAISFSYLSWAVGFNLQHRKGEGNTTTLSTSLPAYD